jgi:predicted transcriptional regulator
MQQSKVVTVRIDPDDAHRAELIARADSVSVNEVFRQALLHYFELKRADAEFVERAEAMVARDAEIVGGLR